MTASAHTTAMQAPTERNPDYRTRADREAEVLAQIGIDGHLSVLWVTDNRTRAAAVDRLVKAGRIRCVPGGAYPLARYEVVKPAAPSVWSRLVGWLGGLAS